MAKQNAPWFAFNVHDWLTSIDIQRMTLAEVGAYINLLARAWDSDPIATLPNDPAKLWKLAGARSLDEFQTVAPVVLAMFEEQDGRLVNRRLIEETARLNVAESIRIERARNAAQARWGKPDAQACSSIPQAMHSDAWDAKQRTDTDSVKENKPSQLVTESVRSESESAHFFHGSQSPLQSSQPESLSPPTQSLSGDRFALALDVLQREEPGQENPIAWAQRMVATWHGIRMEKNYAPSDPEEVSAQDFGKLISPAWLLKAGFTQPISRAEIQLCLQWALRTSDHWGKRDMLLGSAGFVNAFGAIKRQCFNYHASKETRNLQIGKKEENAHPALQEKPQPAVTIVKPTDALKDNTMAGVMQELRDMRTDSASAQIGSSKWKALRFRELREEYGVVGAEVEIEREMKNHEANAQAVRDAVRERGTLSADEIQKMLASDKVKNEGLSNVADL